MFTFSAHAGARGLKSSLFLTGPDAALFFASMVRVFDSKTGFLIRIDPPTVFVKDSKTKGRTI